MEDKFVKVRLGGKKHYAKLKAAREEVKHETNNIKVVTHG